MIDSNNYMQILKYVHKSLHNINFGYLFTFKLDETLPAKPKLCTYMELKLEFLYLKNIFKPTS